MDNTFDWYAFSEGLGKISCDRIIHLGNNKWDSASVLNEGYNQQDILSIQPRRQPGGHNDGATRMEPLNLRVSMSRVDTGGVRQPSHSLEKDLYKNLPVTEDVITKVDLTGDDYHHHTNFTDEEEDITKKDEELRLCEVAWTEEKWIRDAIWPFMEEANKASGWKYDIKYAEAMQITKYKKGGFYGWHRDGKSDHLSVYNMPENGYMHDKVRKLSMSVSLNEDFEGGDLELAFYKEEKCNIRTIETNKLGNIVVFPSYQEHRITPVTKGTRYALVVWFIGPPFV